MATMTDKLVMRNGTRTPWGTAQAVRMIAPGIGEVTTAGHGGIKLSAELNRGMPDCMRRKGGWYEEDVDWALVYAVYAEEIQKAINPDNVELMNREYRCLGTAAKTLRKWLPDAYEKFYGKATRCQSEADESTETRTIRFALLTKVSDALTDTPDMGELGMELLQAIIDATTPDQRRRAAGLPNTV